MKNFSWIHNHVFLIFCWILLNTFSSRRTSGRTSASSNAVIKLFFCPDLGTTRQAMHFGKHGKTISMEVNKNKDELFVPCSRFRLFNLRRILCPAGLLVIGQDSTESYRTFCKSDIEKLKKLSFHSVYLTHW